MAMKLSSPLIAIAGVVAFVSFASSTASAQPVNLAPPTKGVHPPRQWTAYDVTAERPFGTIDITPAGSSVESVRLWSLGRSVAERYELNGRCAFMTTPANAPRYRPSDQEFCRNYKLAGFARPMTPRS
jgi:hypothetical protein